jgi:hypothetical protein
VATLSLSSSASASGALVDGDAHVVEGGDDAFDRFRIDDVFRQLVVDLGVGQEAALAALVDQVLDLGAALSSSSAEAFGSMPSSSARPWPCARVPWRRLSVRRVPPRSARRFHRFPA